jgi:hypothetical protein
MALLLIGSVLGVVALHPAWGSFRSIGIGVLVLCMALLSAFMVWTGLSRLLVQDEWRVSPNSLTRIRRILGLPFQRSYLGADLEVSRLGPSAANWGAQPRGWAVRVRRKNREAHILGTPSRQEAQALAAYLQQGTGWPLHVRDG